MNRYIATFHTHLAALLTSRALAAAGVEAQLAPVPRKLSSSCGTCVRFAADDPHLSGMDRDVERVYAVGEDGEHTLLLENR